MNSTTTLPVTEARKNIFKIIEDVQRPSRYYTFTEKGRPRAILMSFQEFESWLETLEVMEDFPNIKSDIEDARKEMERGELVSFEEFAQKEGFGSSHKKHVHTAPRKKGAKKFTKD